MVLGGRAGDEKQIWVGGGNVCTKTGKVTGLVEGGGWKIGGVMGAHQGVANKRGRVRG